MLVNALIFRKSPEKTSSHQPVSHPLNREFSYYITLTNRCDQWAGYSRYDMCPYILQKVAGLFSIRPGVGSIMARSSGAYEGLTGVITQLQVSLVAGYLALQVIGRSIGIGDLSRCTSNATSSP